MPLTAREIECLKWAVDGLTSWETSVILGIAEDTVRFLLDSARKKLNARDKFHAAVIALRSGKM